MSLPFLPLGDTITITAATTAPSGVKPTAQVWPPTDNHYRIVNAGTVTAFLGVGGDATSSTAKALVASGVPILPGAVEVLRFPVDSFFSAITSSGTATIYVTVGEGI